MRIGPRDLSPTGSKLVAGDLCLDFANTATWHASDHPRELLTTYGDLVSWSRRADLLDATGSERLLRKARRRPGVAARALRGAVALRDVIYRMVVAIVQRRLPEASDLDAFNQALSAAIQHLRVVPARGGLAWSWDCPPRALDGMLWPILHSAAELLTSERRGRIGQCADDRGCGWLFLDRSKNHSRRWCEMGDCGNRAKARRHYRRGRGGPTRPRGVNARVRPGWKEGLT